MTSRKDIRVWVAALAALIAGSSVVQAQSDSQRRELFDNLLRTLIDSRLEDSQQVHEFHAPPPLNRPPYQDRNLQRTLNSFSDELTRLFDILASDVRRNPMMRTYLGETLEVQASAQVLSRLVQQQTEYSIIRNEFSTLDRQWRLLSHRLQGSTGLSTSARASVQKIDSLSNNLSGIFDVKPQVDDREFLRLTDSMENDLRHLNEDIAIELGRTAQARQLLVQGRLIEQQVSYMASAIELQKSREKAVTEFNKFHELWGPFAAQLWPLKNRYLERSLQRIEQADRQLHEVLWLDLPIDNRQLSRLTDVLTSDVDLLFKKTTLHELMDLPSRDDLIRYAGSFSDANKRLETAINDNRPLPQLQTEFRTVGTAWSKLEATFRGCDEPEILRLIKATDQTMVSIQEALQMEVEFDRDLAVQILASLENYGEHLQENFSTLVLPNPQYSRRFSIQGLHTSQQFTAFARNIHYDLAEGVEPEELRARCDTLVRGWKYLNEEYIHKLNGAEREQLSRLSAQIAPLMVQLQTLFEV